MLIAEEDWRSVASRRSADPDLFFPVSSSGKALEQAAEAKAICAGCRVRRECLAFARATHQIHGVWGGMTERERYLLRRADGRRTDPGTGDGCRIACLRMTAEQLTTLHGSVERASGRPARSRWDRTAAAHAEIFGLLAGVARGPGLAPVRTLSPGRPGGCPASG